MPVKLAAQAFLARIGMNPARSRERPTRIIIIIIIIVYSDSSLVVELERLQRRLLPPIAALAA